MQECVQLTKQESKEEKMTQRASNIKRTPALKVQAYQKLRKEEIMEVKRVNTCNYKSKNTSRQVQPVENEESLQAGKWKRKPASKSQEYFRV